MLVAGPGGQPFPNLPLNRDEHGVHPGRPLQEIHDHGDGNVVGKVRGHPPPALPQQPPPVCLEGVEALHADPLQAGHDLGEGRDEGPVHLHGEHLGAGPKERQGQASEPRPHLEDAIPGPHSGLPHDRPGHVRIGKKVLAQAPAGADSVAGRQILQPPPSEQAATRRAGR